MTTETRAEMNSDDRQPSLATIATRLAAAERELAALRGAARRQRPPRAGWVARWRRLGAALTLVVLLALAPLGVFAANFVDLNPGSPHNGNIDAIAAAGITKGCIDAQHYCPNSFVTREEMASFLARTAGLGGNAPVTNAKTAQTAGNADKLAGHGPSDFARAEAGGEICDSYTLGNQGIACSRTLSFPSRGLLIVMATGTIDTANSAVGLAYGFNTGNGSGSALYDGAVANSAHLFSLQSTFVVDSTPDTYSFTIARTSGSGGKLLTIHMIYLYIPFKLDGSPY